MDAKRTLLEGLGAGVLGYAVVAVFYAALDLVAGRPPFETAYLLGEALGAGAPGPGSEIGVVLAANGLHLVVSLILGLAAAFIVAEVEHHHALWYVLLTLFLGGVMLAIVATGILGAEVAGALSWTAIGLGAVIGAGAMAAFLVMLHPGLVQELSREEREREV